MFWFLMFVRFCLPQNVSGECVSGMKAALNLTAGAPQDVLEIEGYFDYKKGKNLSALIFSPIIIRCLFQIIAYWLFDFFALVWLLHYLCEK